MIVTIFVFWTLISPAMFNLIQEAGIIKLSLIGIMSTHTQNFKPSSKKKTHHFLSNGQMRKTKGNKKEVNKTESKHRGVLSSSPTKPKNTQSIKEEEKGYQDSFHSEKKKKPPPQKSTYRRRSSKMGCTKSTNVKVENTHSWASTWGLGSSGLLGTI
jgi:hypothetical protein